MHFHLPKPLHGWREFAGEVGIIVIGVLIALGAEQLIEQWHWEGKAREARAALKREAIDHYFYAVEWRMSAPCIAAQLDRLERRLDSSGATLDPAPVLSDPGTAGIKRGYIVRTPDRPYSLSVWQGTVSDGTSAHFSPDDRQAFDFYTRQVADVHELNTVVRREAGSLMVMKKPSTLDPEIRLDLQRSIDQLRLDNDEMDLVAGQIVRSIVGLHMAPESRDLDKFVGRSGTIALCRSQHLFLLSKQDAEKPGA